MFAFYLLIINRLHWNQALHGFALPVTNDRQKLFRRLK